MIPALSHFLQAMVFTVRNAPVPLPGSKKTTNATKMPPKIGLKALGHKGFKIGSIWDGYQNATSGTFRHEKRRFFMLFTRFSQEIFACKRCDTELNWSEKPLKPLDMGGYPEKCYRF